MADDWKNKLYFGDNLDIMRQYIPDESVDLIYLDPPFNSKATYNVLFAEKNGTRSAAQITAFEDTWHWDMKTEAAYREIVSEGPKKLADLIQSLRSFLGQNDMMAYLVMMAIRLVEMRRVLRDTGSLYLHCDPTASHYLKLVLDASFGAEGFRNEIVWKRTGAHNSAKRYGPVHDVILYYSKSDRYIWNQQYQAQDEYVEQRYTYVDDRERRFYPVRLIAAGTRKGSSGQSWRGIDVTSKGNHWRYTIEKLEELDAAGDIYWPPGGGLPRLKMYAENAKGSLAQDWWDDISAINSQALERLGYPTQKPLALLERIIKASSNEGDLVLDPFCGCGTTISVAEQFNRRWIGIDITHLAITLMRHRLENAFGTELAPYEVIGDPKDLSSAQALAEQDRYQFEWWALGKVAARPAQDKRKGADTGIDGVLNFFDDNSGKAKKVIVQVKSGHVNAAYVRDLKGVLEREKSPIGVLITLEEPTRPMLQEAAAGGFYEPEHFPGLRYPRLQILTIEGLLSGKHIEYPRLAPEATFKRAERKRKAQDGEQKALL